MTTRVFDPHVFDRRPIFDTGSPGGIWDDRTKQAEVWASSAPGRRVFDPAVFDNSPIFDTGQAGGYWAPKAKQPEIWNEI